MEGVETAAQSSSSAQAESSTTSILYTPSSSSNPGGCRSKSKKRKSKKRGDESDDSSESDFIGSSDDEKYAPSSSRHALRGRSRIIFCIECKGRFARKDEEEEQLKCPDCVSGLTALKNKKKAAPRKKQLVVIKKDTLPKEHLPSLQDLCIAVVAEYIDEVEALGVISEDSLEKLAKIISRNRKLNDRTSRLFMEPFRKSLSLYDCTNMTEVALENISQFCPRMEHLELIYCGHITSKVVKAYADRLHFLKSLQLSGAFLVSKEAWNHLFEKVGKRLETFSVRHTARFVKENMEALAKRCPNLKQLKLGHLAHMDSDWLSFIGTFKKLHTLEFAWSAAEHPLKTEDVVDMLSKIGPQLVDLAIKGGHELDDKILSEGLLKHCPNLKKLNLEQCDQLTPGAMADFLKNWQSARGGLTHLDISRCIEFDDEVLKAVLTHSGSTLRHLNLHSLEKLSPTALELLGGGDLTDEDGKVVGKVEPLKELVWLDCGFVRSMDDFVLQKVITNCTSLRDIQVWGCHMVK